MGLPDSYFLRRNFDISCRKFVIFRFLTSRLVVCKTWFYLFIFPESWKPESFIQCPCNFLPASYYYYLWGRWGLLCSVQRGKEKAGTALCVEVFIIEGKAVAHHGQGLLQIGKHLLAYDMCAVQFAEECAAQFSTPDNTQGLFLSTPLLKVKAADCILPLTILIKNGLKRNKTKKCMTFCTIYCLQLQPVFMTCKLYQYHEKK